MTKPRKNEHITQEVMILRLVADCDGITSGDVSNQLNMSTQNAAQLLKRLYDDGLITRELFRGAFTYRIAPGQMVDKRKRTVSPDLHVMTMVEMKKEQAGILENKGLWRRATAIWSEISCLETDPALQLKAEQRANYCHSKALDKTKRYPENSVVW